MYEAMNQKRRVKGKRRANGHWPLLIDWAKIIPIQHHGVGQLIERRSQMSIAIAIAIAIVIFLVTRPMRDGINSDMICAMASTMTRNVVAQCAVSGLRARERPADPCNLAPRGPGQRERSNPRSKYSISILFYLHVHLVYNGFGLEL